MSKKKPRREKGSSNIKQVGLAGPHTKDDRGDGVVVFTTKIGQITIKDGLPIPGPDGKF
jgi:hypothetical protein